MTIETTMLDNKELQLTDVTKVEITYDENGAYALQITAPKYTTDIPFGMCKSITINN